MKVDDKNISAVAGVLLLGVGILRRSKLAFISGMAAGAFSIHRTYNHTWANGRVYLWLRDVEPKKGQFKSQYPGYALFAEGLVTPIYMGIETRPNKLSKQSYKTLETLRSPSPHLALPYDLIWREDGAVLTPCKRFDHDVAEAQLSIKEVAQAFLGAARGLAEMHKLGFIHGDIKPDNIVCNEPRESALIDFGMVRSVSKPRETVGGALGYLSPERFESKGKLDTIKGDCYAFGMALFKKLVGKNPSHIGRVFVERRGSIRVNLSRWKEGIPESDWPANFPPQIKQLILDLTNYNADCRPDMQQVIERLIAFLN